MHISARAGATIRSFRSRCRSRPRPGLASSFADGPQVGEIAPSSDRRLASPARHRPSASSIHATFLQESDLEALEAEGFLRRDDQQFHWFNEGYGTFEDFLAALSSRKRKAIRRERRDALGNGISIEWLTGAEITQAHWDAFFAFYMDTGSRKWGRPYLNRRFFSLIGERMADRVLLVMAKRQGRYIAGAINFIGDTQALRPQLGLHRGSSVPAFRGLLLSGDRVRHRARARPGRGGRSGRAQARARISARHHVVGP